MDGARRYWFPVIGYNYRMTNIQAAIGLAQLERIDWFIERRREVAGWYVKHLQDTDLILPPEAKWAKSVFWLFSVCVPNRISRDAVMSHMAAEGIETRPFFIPLHTMPPYQDCAADGIFPITTALAATGLNLPSSATLSEDDVAYVCRVLKQCL